MSRSFSFKVLISHLRKVGKFESSVSYDCGTESQTSWYHSVRLRDLCIMVSFACGRGATVARQEV